MGEDAQRKSNKNAIIMIAAVVIIIAIVIGGAVFLKLNKSSQTVVETPADTNSSASGEPNPSAMTGTYKDGKYSANGEYSYHSGIESIGVTLSLKNGVIDSVEVQELAKAPISKKMQDDFAANYKSLVVGKNIDEVNLGKVSGSSLTPKGFNAAIELIKTQAKS